MSSMRQWKTWLFLVVMAGAVGGLFAVDEQGLRRYRLMKAEAEALQAENTGLAAQNARLAREAAGLRGNAAVLERAAREELRFIRPGELIYLLDAPPPGGTP
jgi:cell division protein FtsB